MKLYDNIVCIYVEISIDRVKVGPYKEYNFTGEKEHDCVSLFYHLRICVILEHHPVRTNNLEPQGLQPWKV